MKELQGVSIEPFAYLSPTGDKAVGGGRCEVSLVLIEAQHVFTGKEIATVPKAETVRFSSAPESMRLLGNQLLQMAEFIEQHGGGTSALILPNSGNSIITPRT